jgi:5-methylcytosine-specific restriction endonuclease McrA
VRYKDIAIRAKVRQKEHIYGTAGFAGAKDISGPLQYQVLKRAKGRCELCHISGKVKALQVDHIKPRSKGASDSAGKPSGTVLHMQCPEAE